MLLRRHVVPSAVVALVVGLVLPQSAAASPTQPTDGGATTLLSGELLLVADAERPGPQDHEPGFDEPVLALLEVDGLTVPIEPSAVDGLDSGTRLTIEVPVPDDLATSIEDGQPVAVTADGDSEVLPPSVLTAATTEPAPAGSDLAGATTVAAATTPVPLETTVLTAEPPVVTASAGVRRDLTVAVVGVHGLTDSRYTDAGINRLVVSASDYWSEQSAGSITFKVAGPITRYTSSVACSNDNALWNEAVAQTGFVRGANKHLVVMLPRDAYDTRHCGYGLGTVGSGPSAGGLLYVADAAWPVLAHELGHNLSLWHANNLSCQTPTSDVLQSTTGHFSACSEEQYGDQFDVMSYSHPDASGNVGVVGLQRLGLLNADEQARVTSSGVTEVSLTPLSSRAGVRSKVVVDPRNGNTYYLENRQPTGRDVFGWGGWGLYHPTKNAFGTTYGLRILKRGPSGSSVILDPTPSINEWDPHTVVPPNTMFRSVGGGVEIRATAGVGGAVVAQISVARSGEAHWPAALGKSTITVDQVPGAVPVGAPVVLSGTVVTAAGRPATGLVSVSSSAGATATGATDPSGRYSIEWTPTRAGSATVLVSHAAVAGEHLGSAASQVIGVAATTAINVGSVSATATKAITLPITVAMVGGGAEAPVGTVTVTSAGTRLGTATLSRGKASVKLQPLPVGVHDLRVDYTPAAATKGTVTTASTLSAPLTVVGATTKLTTALAKRSVTLAEGASVTVTASASGTTPTGTVTVTGGGATLATGPLTKGRATLILPRLTLGQHSLQVEYQGDTKAASAVSTPLTLTVDPLPVSALTVSATKATTATQSTLTVSVKAAGKSAPGSVTLSNAGSTLAAGTLANGRASFKLPLLPAGTHTLRITHADTATVTGSTVTATVVVSPAKPVVKASLGATKVTVGTTAPVAVTVSSPAGTPTGEVRLMRAKTVLSTATLVDGRATLAAPGSLPVGRSTFTVSYSGSTELAPAASGSLSLTVSKT